MLITLPAIRGSRDFLAVPHLGFPEPAICDDMFPVFAPANPAAGAPFAQTPSPPSTGGGEAGDFSGAGSEDPLEDENG